ncbi:MAG: glycosyltransferase family 4 protein [Pyrinomonadaceae bacterium]|nr:glycosyltransferase family 4 protein [Pyrinomonadaceae bacterium]
MPIRNILICTTQVPFTTGGGELHVEHLRRAFVEADYNAEVVALPFKWYPPVEIMRGTFAWRMLDLTQANGKPVDLVIGMKFPAYTVAHPNKVLWIMHQHRSAYNLFNTPFDDLSTYPEGARVREFIRHCDNRFIPEAKRVFANSQTVAERLLHYNKIESTPLYHPPPGAELLRTGELGDYVFYPSRVEPQKRQELLIEAMSFCRTPVRCILAGSAPDKRRYEDLIKRHKVGHRVELRGFVGEREMIELYARALTVCYLPFDEDYGYVTLEAMLAARPVITTTDAGGAREFVEHDGTGFVVEPQPQQIAAAIDELYRDRARAQKLGARGREKIRAMNLSWQTVVASLVSAARS